MDMRNELRPFIVDGVEFIPRYYLLQVDEPDFGCEGCPEGEAACGTVRLRDENGQRDVLIEEETLFATRLDDRMWIGIRDGVMGLVNRNREWLPMNDTERKWLTLLG